MIETNPVDPLLSQNTTPSTMCRLYVAVVPGQFNIDDRCAVLLIANRSLLDGKLHDLAKH